MEGYRNFHKFDLTGLDIECKYYYRITNDENISSPIYTFHTAIKKDTPFSFIAYGDNKNGPFNHEKIANLVLKERPNFVVHNGDLVDRGGALKQWDRLFFTPTRNLIREIPLFPVIGNHEDNHLNYYKLSMYGPQINIINWLTRPDEFSRIIIELIC